MNPREFRRLRTRFHEEVRRREIIWPSPVASRMTAMLHESPGEKVLGIVGFLDSLLSFLGSILISLYLNDSEKHFPHARLNRCILGFLRTPPTLGQWIRILREGTDYFSGTDNFLMPELTAFAKGISDPLEKENRKIRLIDELLPHLNTFRLGVGHPDNLSVFLKKNGVVYSAGEDLMSGYEKALPFVIPALLRLILGLDFLSAYWLFYLKGRFADDIFDIRLYRSARPEENELRIPDSAFHDPDFSPNLYRNRLFLAPVTESGQEPGLMQTRHPREVNPVLINWLQEKESLPFRFLRWKDKKKKRMIMGDIISLKQADEIPDPDTRERLFRAYYELKNLLESGDSGASEQEDKDESGSGILPEKIHSEKRHAVICAEIYPHLNIADELLGGISAGDRSIPGICVRNDPDRISGLSQTLHLLRKKKKFPHAVLLGDGGMGKTTSLLKLWEELLHTEKETPVPFFLRLESYNRMKPARRRDYIFHIISEEYCNRIPSEEDIRHMENAFRQPVIRSGGTEPSVILLLDGYNEISADTADLLIHLNHIRKMPGVQMIISSRYDIRPALGWTDFAKLELPELEDGQIRKFMESRNTAFHPDLPTRLPLLRNPMMLTLYCGLEREMKQCADTGQNAYDFIPEPRTKAELLHNSMQSFLARRDRMSPASDDRVMHRLMLHHLLPRLGYEMEKAGIYEIENEGLRQMICEESRLWLTDAFLDAHPDIDNAMSENLMEKLHVSGQRQARILYKTIFRILTKDYALLRSPEGQTCGFLHQDFRDYFAVAYTAARIRADAGKKNPGLSILKNRLFPFHLRAMLGGLSGEHHRAPAVRKGIYQKGKIRETFLDKSLGLLRGQEICRGDYRLLNILETLKETRCDLSDTDLSDLDLRYCVLNNIRLGHGKIQGRCRGAVLSKTRIKPRTFFPQGHSSWIRTVTYSPDMKYFISAGNDKTIKEWDSETGECRNTYKGHSDTVNTAFFSPDGNRIISASDDKTIKEWDRETQRCIHTYNEHFDAVSYAVFSPDSRYIISGSHDNTLKKWDTKKKECLGTYTGHFDWIKCVAWSPDGNTFLSAGEDETIREWNADRGDCIRIYTGHSECVTFAAYHPEGQYIVSASKDNSVKEWDTETGKCVRTYSGHLYYVNCVCYSSDGRHIISASDDDTLREWNRESGECIRIYYGHSRSVYFASYSADKQRLISAGKDNTIKEWNAVSGECIRSFEGNSVNVTFLSFSPEGDRIVSGGPDNSFNEWDTEKGECIRTYKGHKRIVYQAVCRPDGQRIASTGRDKTVREWNTENGECIRIYQGHVRPVSTLAYKPDGKNIVSGSWDNTLREWDTRSGKCIRIYHGHSHWITFVNYSPDGLRIISASRDNTLREWDTKSGKCIRSYKGHSFIINAAHYHPEEKRILSAGADKTVREWDTESGKCIRIYEGHTDRISNAVYHPAGTRMISSAKDKTIREWNTESGECIRIFTGHSAGVTAVTYSPDGKFFFSASSDGTWKQWDTESGECIRTFRNIPGLLIQGTDMRNLHPDSEIPEEEKNLLRQYGAVME